MGRRRPAAAFSLFSFQDIITSVTAILVLVMILLTIELITRQRNAAKVSPDSTRRHVQATATRLESVAANLREEFAARRAQRTGYTLKQAQVTLAGFQADLVTAQLRLDETKRTQAAVTSLLGKVEREAAIYAENSKQLATLQRQLDEDRHEADQLEAANRIEQERQEDRKRRGADMPRSGTVLVFNPSPDPGRRAWLVELSGDGVRAALLGDYGPKDFGQDTGSGSAMEDWIASLIPKRDYCLLLIRPTANRAMETLIERRLTVAGIRFGVDLIGEDQSVCDGSQLAN